MADTHIHALFAIALLGCAPHKVGNPALGSRDFATSCYQLTVPRLLPSAPLKMPFLIHLRQDGHVAPPLQFHGRQVDAFEGTWRVFGSDSLIIDWGGPHEKGEVLVNLNPQGDSLKGRLSYYYAEGTNGGGKVMTVGSDSVVASAVRCP